MPEHRKQRSSLEHSRRKPQSVARSTPTRRLPLIVASAFAVLGVIVGAWLLFSGDGNGGVSQPGNGEGAEALNITREPVAIRTQQALIGRDISEPVTADTGPWSVTPDGVASPTGLRSVFAWPETDATVLPAVLLFARPDVAHAAILAPGPQPNSWTRYDLKTVDPLGRVELPPDPDAAVSSDREVAFLADLSPSGNRLALQRIARPFRVQLWAADGKRAASLNLPRPATWLGLIDDQRLLVLAGGQLRLHDLGTGQTVYSVEGTYSGQVVLSPGRVWAAAFDGQAFVWFRTADGKVAGRTPTPTLKENAGEFRGAAHGAFSPDGKHFLAARTASGAMGILRCLSLWDVATGKPLAAADHLVGGGLSEHILWCGPRQLLLGGTRLVDLDLGLSVGAGGLRPPDAALTARTTPDGRLWYMPFCKPAYQPDKLKTILPLLEGSPHRPAVEKHGLILAACSLPASARARVDAHKNAITLSKMTVRVDVKNDDAAYRRQAGDALADALAAVGCRVAPGSTSVARLTIGPIKSDLVRKRAPDAPGFRIDEIVPGKYVEAKLEVLDDSGAVRWSVAFNESEPDSTPNPTAAVGKKLINRLARMLRGDAGQLPPLDVADEVGIDGVTP